MEFIFFSILNTDLKHLMLKVCAMSHSVCINFTDARHLTGIVFSYDLNW